MRVMLCIDSFNILRTRENTHGIWEDSPYRKANGGPLSTPMEYFAETSEAYFGQNDVFPFVKVELKRHDPNMYSLLEELWGVEKNRRAKRKGK